jgi:hypothetical protein
MVETGAVAALKAAFRGALRSGEALGPLAERVEALTEAEGPDGALLEDLARVAAGAAVAVAALRGLSESLSQRHAASTPARTGRALGTPGEH